MKKISLAFLAVAGLFANASAFAADCPLTATTISSFISGSCTQQDKLYSNFQFASYAPNSVTNSTIGFDYQVISGKDTHVLSLNLSPSVVAATDQNFSFNYEIQILNPTLRFEALSQGFTKIAGSNAFSTTKFYDFDTNTLLGTVSDNGVTVLDVLGGGYTHLKVQTSVTVNSGALTQISQSFTESGTTIIPEIDALAGTGALTLLAGAVALAGERRRRRG